MMCAHAEMIRRRLRRRCSLSVVNRRPTPTHAFAPAFDIDIRGKCARISQCGFPTGCRGNAETSVFDSFPPLKFRVPYVRTNWVLWGTSGKRQPFRGVLQFGGPWENTAMQPRIVQGLALYFSLYSAPCRTVLLTTKALDLQLPPEGMRELNIHQKYEHLERWFEQINYEKVVPTLIDNGFVLWESRAIAKYLVQKYATGKKKYLYPSDFMEQSLVDRLLFFDQGVLYQSIYDYFKPQAVLSETPNPILGAELERSLQLLSRLLLNKRFVLGGAGGSDHLTIADFSILSSLSHLDSMDYSYEKYKPVRNYVEFLKDNLHYYGECCQAGISLMQDWSRNNLKYLPKYLAQPNIPYDDEFVMKPENRI